MGMIAVRFLMNLPNPKGTQKIDASRGTTSIIDQTLDPDCLLHTPIGKTMHVDIGSKSTLKNLKACCPENSIPLSLFPIQVQANCTKCEFTTSIIQLPQTEKCPNCSATLRSETTLELDNLPDDIKLEDIGIPPREILALRTDNGFEWIELREKN
jgi:hypothetical protein